MRRLIADARRAVHLGAMIRSRILRIVAGLVGRAHAGGEAAVAMLATEPTGEMLDRRTLGALVDEGADLALETDVQLFLLFPTEGHARSAQSVVRREGHLGDVLASDEPDAPWVLAVHRTMVPALENVRAARARYTSLAMELGGTFDGWEAAVRGPDVR